MRIKSSIASEICFSSNSTSALNDRPSRSPALPSFIKSATQDQTYAPLAALAPEPRVHLSRFHGVFAANSKHRIQVTPGKREKEGGQAKAAASHWLEKTPQEPHRAMTWMQQPKRVFGIDIETCERCGREVKVMASIEAPAVIAHILKHLQQKEALKADIQPHERPPERLPPVMRLFD